jgi:hypothetical protein
VAAAARGSRAGPARETSRPGTALEPQAELAIKTSPSVTCFQVRIFFHALQQAPSRCLGLNSLRPGPCRYRRTLALFQQTRMSDRLGLESEAFDMIKFIILVNKQVLSVCSLCILMFLTSICRDKHGWLDIMKTEVI